jgi:hypothetical protein
MDSFICLAYQDINIEEVFHLLACQAVELWSAGKKSSNTQPASTSFRRGSLRFSAALQSEGWARQDSNLGPRDYESPALTAELQALVITGVKHSKPLVTNPESFRGCSNSELLREQAAELQAPTIRKENISNP